MSDTPPLSGRALNIVHAVGCVFISGDVVLYFWE